MPRARSVKFAKSTCGTPSISPAFIGTGGAALRSAPCATAGTDAQMVFGTVIIKPVRSSGSARLQAAAGGGRHGRFRPTIRSPVQIGAHRPVITAKEYERRARHAARHRL